MTNYDFKALSPYEFQSLVNDLLSAQFSIHFESFKPGADFGIDGRHAFHDGKKWIIQSKHYLGTGFNGLLNKLKKQEYQKIVKLNPDRYCFATSIQLSVSDKKKICKCLHPFIKSSTDIFSQDDLNTLLRRFPSIEKEWMKLWLPNDSRIFQLIHHEIYQYGREILIKAQEQSKSYAKTAVYEKAKRMLAEQRTLIIAGQPGIGKTTLAEQLCIEYVASGYTLVAIEDDISEARKVFSDNEKQIFFFDDFLGSNYLDSVRCKKDSSIMQFINRIKHTGNKVMILTSRTNILDNGYMISQAFSSMNLKKQEFILAVADYSISDKGRILYEMIWRYGIAHELLNEIVANHYYTRIIKHRNFNPRIIEFILTNYMQDGTCKSYLEYIDEALNNPSQVWDHPYTTQLDDLSRAVVDFVVLSGGTIEHNDIVAAFDKFKASKHFVSKENSPSDAKGILRILSRTFIQRNRNESDVSIVKYQAFNHSITDYIFNRYLENVSQFAEMIFLLDVKYAMRILTLFSGKNNEFSENAAKIIIAKHGASFWKFDFYEIARMSNFLTNDEFKKLYSDHSIDDIFVLIESSDFIDENILYFCERIFSGIAVDDNKLGKLFNILLQFDYGYNELIALSNLMRKLEIKACENEWMINAFYLKLKNVFDNDSSRVSDFIFENIELTSVDFSDGEEYYDIDKKRLVTRFQESTEDMFVMLQENDARAILGEFDLDDIARQILNHDAGNFGGRIGLPTNKDFEFDIDALFFTLLESM